MKAIVMMVGLVLIAGITAGAVATRRPVAHSYRRRYVGDTFGKRSLAGVGGRAAVGQMLNHPRQWGRGGTGLGKRLGTGMATHVIKNSIEYPIAAARHEDLRYHRSTERGVGARLRHALVSTVVARKTTTGKKTVAAGRISGAMGSGMIASTWAPAAAGGLATGGITLGATAASNVAREFWPQKKHRRG
jgi:hypothetical protein